MRLLLTICLILCFLGSSVIAAENSNLKFLLKAIPNSTEVLLIDREPYILGDSDKQKELDIWIFQTLTTTILPELGSGNVYKRFKGKRVSKSIVATRNITHGTINGFLGGQILLFEQTLSKDEIALIKKNCFRLYDYKNNNIGVFKNKSKGAATNHDLYVSVPRSNLMVLSLDQLFIEQFLCNLDNNFVSEWATIQVNPHDAFIAIRRYKKGSKDLYSPFNEKGAFRNKYADPHAKSIQMRFSCYSPKKIRVRYDGSESGADMIALVLNHPYKIACISKTNESFREFDINVPEKQKRALFSLIAMPFFGHALEGCDL